MQWTLIYLSPSFSNHQSWQISFTYAPVPCPHPAEYQAEYHLVYVFQQVSLRTQTFLVLSRIIIGKLAKELFFCTQIQEETSPGAQNVI